MKGKRAVAAAVTSVGVLAIWAMATVRQEDQTRELGRQWVGEQWDIARRCVVGTPIGRRDAEEAVADRLAANAVDTLASVAFEDEAPDPARLWPARCAPLLSGLNVDPSVTGGTDLSRPVAELEALARHALTLDDPAQTLLRARELAGPIHVLDGAMPPGAEYDPTHFDPPRADAGAFEASLRCQEPAGAPEAAPCAAEDGDPGGGSPRPAGEPRLEACDGERSVALWPEGRRWTGTRCEGTSQRAAASARGRRAGGRRAPRGRGRRRHARPMDASAVRAGPRGRRLERARPGPHGPARARRRSDHRVRGSLDVRRSLSDESLGS